MTRKQSDKKLYHKILLVNVLHSLFAALWWMIIIRWIVKDTTFKISGSASNPKYNFGHWLKTTL